MTEDERTQEIQAIRRLLIDACGRITALDPDPHLLGLPLWHAREDAHRAVAAIDDELGAMGEGRKALPWGPVFDEIERRRQAHGKDFDNIVPVPKGTTPWCSMCGAALEDPQEFNIDASADPPEGYADGVYSLARGPVHPDCIVIVTNTEGTRAFALCCSAECSKDLCRAGATMANGGEYA